MGYEEKVRSIISKIIKIKGDNINNEDDLVDKYGMDSMQRVEIVIELEKEYDISISDETALTLRTLQQIINHLKLSIYQHDK